MKKLEIIETPDYSLAVSDEEIKEGDFALDLTEDMGLKYDAFKVDKATLKFANQECEKIIAYQPKGDAKELDLPLLPEMVVGDEVEKLAEIDVRKVMGHLFCKDSLQTLSRIEMFKRGHKAATKVYSEEDLTKAIISGIIKMGLWQENEPHITPGKIVIKQEEIAKEVTQSLKQPKTPKWFVAEYEYIPGGRVRASPDLYREGYGVQLKTTTIKGKQILIGTYELK